MRGALEPLPGTLRVNVRPGRKSVTVAFDAGRISPDEMLAALKKAGEEASLRPPRAESKAVSDPRPVDAIRAVLQACDRFPIVALVEPGGLEEEHDFIASLIRDPEFPAKVNDLVVEFGNSLYQETLDQHVAGKDVAASDLSRVLRDSLYSPFGAWEAPVYARLFANVRNRNLHLPPSQRIRVIVTGAPIDWGRIQTPEDHDRFRESFGPEKPHVAALVEREVLKKGRRALVIGSQARLFRRDEKNDLASIEKTHPRSVFVVTPHVGFEEPDLETRLLSWPRPALARLEGTWLGNQYEDEFTFTEVADAYLYLGPRDSLKVSQPDPEIYRDEAYFEELSRRYRIQAGDDTKLERAELMRERPRRFVDAGH